MNPIRKLQLRRESITDLTDLALDDLRGIAGADSGSTCPCVTTVHRECPSDPVTGCTVIRVTQYETCIC